jgi:hypothetical protein
MTKKVVPSGCMTASSPPCGFRMTSVRVSPTRRMCGVQVSALVGRRAVSELSELSGAFVAARGAVVETDAIVDTEDVIDSETIVELTASSDWTSCADALHASSANRNTVVASIRNSAIQGRQSEFIAQACQPPPGRISPGGGARRPPNKKTSTIPAMKPPMWAMYATPPSCPPTTLI